MKKAELVHWLEEEQRGWEGLLEQIAAFRMDQPGANGDWSVKDLLAHLTAWQNRLIRAIQAAHRNEPEPPPPWPAHLQTEDEINAWIYEHNHRRSVDDVLDESHQMFQQLLTVMQALPDDVRIETVASAGKAYYVVWLGDKRFPPGEFFYHFHDDHESTIRAWLAQAARHET